MFYRTFSTFPIWVPILKKALNLEAIIERKLTRSNQYSFVLLRSIYQRQTHHEIICDGECGLWTLKSLFTQNLYTLMQFRNNRLYRKMPFLIA